MHEVRLPKWGQVMEEAIVVEWLKEVGDEVGAAEPIVVVETDKADGEIASPVAGVLVEICAEAEATVPVEGLLAKIEER
jgi:pyruvate/2-oxoglutarate dehydrogenase complex dihydrolipoamide acyltransferase (E2) component